MRRDITLRTPLQDPSQVKYKQTTRASQLDEPLHVIKDISKHL